MIAKEKMAITKMKLICELEERHGIDLDSGYKNDRAFAMFIEAEIKAFLGLRIIMGV